MKDLIFEEKQYLGSNQYSLVGRTILALFCFTAYYWSENPKPVEVSGIWIGSYPGGSIPNSGALFFLMGMVILIVSAILVFVLHTRTQISGGSLVIDGLWTARKVKIILGNIVSAEHVPYSRTKLNRSVYNLHRNGVIYFYTGGNDAVLLTDRDGLKYQIGTQKPRELISVITTEMKKDINN